MTSDDGRVLTVGKLNEYVKMLVDNNPVLANVWVKGEISNLTIRGNGHIYFSLKDEGSRVAAVMFRGDAVKLKFLPENGMKVLLHGRVSVYTRDGAYQIYAASMEPDGVGALYIAFEQLKRKLEAEGLFSPAGKRALPKIPRTVGVITSPTGAAFRDIINVTGRRFPFAKILLFPSLVQGEGAAENLADGIRYFANTRSADVIIIGRGGGSMEDLWCFNSEELAREISACTVPVISAVGHETDFTICDFVADVRAPTPSAAAELAVPDTAELQRKFRNVTDRMETLLSAELRRERERLKALSERRVLTSPGIYIEERRNSLLSLYADMERSVRRQTELASLRYERLAGLLDAYSPLRILSRGYAAIFDGEGNVLKGPEQMKTGEQVVLRMAAGRAEAEIKALYPDETVMTENGKNG